MWAQWRLSRPGTVYGRACQLTVRQWLPRVPGVPAATVAASARRIPAGPAPSEAAYTREEFGQIKAAAARTFGTALVRIRAWRRGRWHVPASAPFTGTDRLPEGTSPAGLSRYGDATWDLSPLSRRQHEPAIRANPAAHAASRAGGPGSALKLKTASVPPDSPATVTASEPGPGCRSRAYPAAAARPGGRAGGRSQQVPWPGVDHQAAGGGHPRQQRVEVLVVVQPQRRRGKGRKGQRRIERHEKAEKTWATPLEALLVAPSSARRCRAATPTSS